MLVVGLKTNYFGSQNLIIANVNDQLRNQFTIKTILIINLKINYNFLGLF